MLGETIEIAIKVIVTLFVALVVGGAIILFAQRTLLRAEDNLHTVGKTQSGVEIISLTDAATSDDVLKLAESCGRINGGNSGSVDCFVLKGSIPELDSLNEQEVAGYPIRVTVASGATAAFISYNIEGYVDITS